MTTLKNLTIVAVLLIGGTSLAMAQNGPATGGERPVAGGANGGGWGGGWYGGAGGMTTGQTSTIYSGQLVVDMYDPANHDLVWRGVASKTLDPKAKPEKRQKNLNKAVAKLMKNYPPQAK